MKEESKKMKLKVDGKEVWLSKEAWGAQKKWTEERERKVIPKLLHQLFGL